MKKFAIVGAIAALTIATAACGGGSDTLSEDDYVDQLQDICTQVNGDLEDLDDPEDYRDLARLGEDAKDITEDGLADLKELKPPKDLEADHDDYVASIERTIDLTDDFIKAAEDEDDAEIEKVGNDLTDEEADRNDIAEDIGADDCIEQDDPVEDPVDTTDVPVTEPTETTEPDEPVDTTEPDEPVDTTEPDETLPRITVPPVDMTMPTDTEPPVVSGSDIGTFDFDNLTTPAGYEWENIDSESLASVQESFATAYEGQLALIGGAFVADSTNGIEFRAFTFFWNEDDIVASGTGQTFLDDFTSTADTSSETTTTAGYPVTVWTDSDGAEAVGAIDSDVSVILYGDPGSTQAMLDFFDAFIDAQG